MMVRQLIIKTILSMRWVRHIHLMLCHEDKYGNRISLSAVMPIESASLLGDWSRNQVHRSVRSVHMGGQFIARGFSVTEFP